MYADINPFGFLNKTGFTFFEVLAASLIASFVAGGTLMAFVTAARITAVQNHSALAEANSFATQTIEKWRNRVAADDEDLTDPTSLAARAATGAWVSEPFDAAPPGGTESIRATAKRCSRVSHDCGLNCYQVEVQVCWNNSPVGECFCP